MKDKNAGCIFYENQSAMNLVAMINVAPHILLLFRNNGLMYKEKKEYLYPCFSMAQLVYLYFFLEIFMCA